MSKNAGYYRLDSFYVQALNEPGKYAEGIELKRAVVQFNITESIDQSFLNGSAVVSESFDALKKVPLRGEERLTVSFTDYFDESYEYVFYVYAITDLKKDPATNGKLMTYTLHFTTFQKLESDKSYVRKSFGEERVSNMASQVFERYFNGDKEIEVQDTDSKQTLVIPRLRSDEAMTFLARRASTADSPSSLFTFFETREKYYFMAYEKLVEKKIDLVASSATAEENQLKYIYTTMNDNEPAGQRVAQFTMNELSYLDRSNTIKSMKQGAYKRNITELDYYNKFRIRTTYDYLEEQPKHFAIDKLSKINTDAFVEAYMPDEEAPEVVYITDYNQLGVAQGRDGSLAPFRNYAQNYMTKTVIDYHMKNSSVTCLINGQGKLMPGSMIYLEVLEFNEDIKGSVIDQERSGPYLIMSVINIFSGDQYKQQLTITKGGLRRTTV